MKWIVLQGSDVFGSAKGEIHILPSCIIALGTNENGTRVLVEGNNLFAVSESIEEVKALIENVR